MSLNKKAKKFSVKSLIVLFSKIEKLKDNSKKILLLKNYRHQKILKQVLINIYSPLRLFKISPKKVKIRLYTEKSKPSFRFILFLSLLNQKTKNKISLIRLKRSLSPIFSTAEKLEKDLYSRILNKDLQIDLKLGVVNAAFPKLITFPGSFTESTSFPINAKLDFPLIAEPELDGDRIKIFSSKGDSIAFTKDYSLVTKMFKNLINLISHLSKKWDTNIEMDGILSNNKLYVFDIILDKEIKTLKYRKRKILTKILSLLEKEISPEVLMLPHIIIKDRKSLRKAIYNLRQKEIKGLILKDPLSTSKKPLWLKINENFITNIKIVEIVKKKFLEDSSKNTCGTLVCKLNGKECSIEDIAKKSREYLWKNRKDLIGKKCKIEMQQNNQSKIINIKNM